MTKRGLGVTVAGAVAVVAGAFAATGVLAGEGEPGPGEPPQAGELRRLTATRVAVPPTAADALARRAAKPPKPRKPTLIYKETTPVAIAPGPDGFEIGFCPTRARVINGYHYLLGGRAGVTLDLQGDAPVQGLRKWAFHFDGGTAGATGVIFGLICLKNVR